MGAAAPSGGDQGALRRPQKMGKKDKKKNKKLVASSRTLFRVAANGKTTNVLVILDKDCAFSKRFLSTQS